MIMEKEILGSAITCNEALVVFYFFSYIAESTSFLYSIDLYINNNTPMLN
jgi:hypothetical protein